MKEKKLLGLVAGVFLLGVLAVTGRALASKGSSDAPGVVSAPAAAAAPQARHDEVRVAAGSDCSCKCGQCCNAECGSSSGTCYTECVAACWSNYPCGH
jgi:hypothetical protein